MSKPKRKILFTVHQFFPEFFAGTEVLTLNTAKEFQRRGYQVCILTLVHTLEPKNYRDGGLKRADYDGLMVWKLDYNFYETPNPLTNEFNNPYMVEFMYTFLAEYKPDLVHIMHTYRFSASVIDVYTYYNVPVVMTATDFWFLCSRIQLMDSSKRNCCGPMYHGAKCIRCIAKQTSSNFSAILDKIPILFIEIGAFFAKWKNNQSDNIKAARFLFERPPYLMKQLNKIDRVIVPTETMKQMLINNGADKDRIAKLHFGLDIVKDSEEPRVKQYNGKVTFAYIGSILEHKGLHVLVKAFSLLDADNASLLIYGDTSANPLYTKQIKEIAGEDKRIKFMGTFPNNQIMSVFKDIDVLVVPSIWYENTPLVIFSAFAAKTPAIGTDLGGITEVVKHGYNGMVFPKNNHKKLLEIIKKFFEEKTLLEKLSGHIEPVKTISQNVNELEIIYDKLLEQR